VIEAVKPYLLCPTCRVVAGLAARGEVTFVRVCMARGALIERKPYVLNVRLRVSDCRMALVA